MRVRVLLRELTACALSILVLLAEVPSPPVSPTLSAAINTATPTPPVPSRPWSGPDAAWSGGSGGLSAAVAESALTTTHLGESLGVAIQALGTPWIVVYQGAQSYWMYRTDSGHAWFVLGVANRLVDSVQISLYAHDSSTLRDSANVRLGGPSSQLPAGQRHEAGGAGDSVLALPSGASAHVFYGVDRTNRIDRIGRALSNDDLAAYARWYEFDGQSADRPVPLTAYGGTAQGENRYVSRLHEPYIPCSGGNSWHVLSRSQASFAGILIAVLRLRCGSISLTRSYYMATTARLPRAFVADARAAELLGMAAPKFKGVQPATTRAQIWAITTNGTRMQAGVLDIHYAVIPDPNNQLESVTAIQAPFGNTNQSGTTNGGPSPQSTPYNTGCTLGQLGGKCTVVGVDDGQYCIYLAANFGGYSINTDVECYMVTDDTSNLSSNPGLSGALGCSGAPVNAVSGNLSYKYCDFQLSGPFGLSFRHRYDSTLACVSSCMPAYQSPYQGDLGVGWISTYGAYLDTSALSQYNLVTFHGSDGERLYFQSLGAGTNSYDQFSGDILYTQSSGYKLVTWDNRAFQFNTSGHLTSMTDRIGNTQTISRSGSTATVTDALGRVLTITYNSSGFIQSIVSSPSTFAGVNVSFTYGTSAGTNNCYTGDLCTATESDGSKWTYQYYNPSSNGNFHLLEYVTDPLGKTEEYDQYELADLSSGDYHYRVSQQSIDNGANQYSYTYVLNGGLPSGYTTITDNANLNHSTTYEWDENLQVVTSVSGYLCFCRGDSLAYTYDMFGRPLSVSEGGAATPTISAQYGRDIGGVNPDGSTFTLLAYPSITQLEQYGILTSTGFQNKITQLAYYAIGTPQQDLPQTVTEPSVDTPGESVVTTLTFSTAGLPTAIARAGYSGGTQKIYSVSATYDGKGRIDTFVGPRTDVTQRTVFSYYPDTDTDYARRGQLQTIADALSHTTSFAEGASPYNSYSIYGGAKSVTDPNAVVTDLIYDLRGRPTQLILNGAGSETQPLTTVLTYDADGHLISTKRPLGNSLQEAFDSANRPDAITIADSSGNQREQFALSYNVVSQLGDLSAQSCATPASTCTTWQTAMTQAFTYATVGTLSNITNGGGGQTSFSWDAYGNSTGFTAGATGSYQYATVNGFDPSHLLTQTQLSGSTSATYTHDLQSHWTRTVSPSTASTSTYVDDFGCAIKQVGTYTGTTTQTCDRAANVTSATDANNATTTTTYDALNRPLVQTSTRSGVPTETVTYTYDTGAFSVGRLSSMTDPSGSTTYGYERRGLLATVNKSVNGGSYVTTYTYDGNGNQTQSQLSANGGTPFALTYAYDYADRPLSVASGSTTYISQALYEPMGPRKQLTYGNGTQQTATFDQGYRPTESKLSNGSGTLSDLLYTVNSAGYVTQITDNLNAGYNESFSYGGKSTNMLTSANTGSSLWERASYSDTVSQNLLNSNFPGRNVTYGYNRVYQLQTLNQPGSGIQNVTHDSVGNETGVGSSGYTYSARELLSSGDGINYTYDGRRQRVTAQTSSGTRAYLYDSSRHLQAEGSLTSSALAYEYVWFGGTPVAQVDVGSGTHWTAADQRGAPFIQTTSSGSLYWQADYEPFGAVYDERTSDVHQPLRLPGQEAEEFSTSEGPNGASPRYYNGFRWYRPQLGRYTQPDPLGYLGSAYNLYAYANNNPSNYIDSLGLDCLPWQGPPSWFWPTVIAIGVTALILSGVGVIAIGADVGAAGAGVALGEFGTPLTGTAIQALEEATESLGVIRNIAGYDVWGTQGLVGETYNVNIAGLYGSGNIFGLLNALSNQATIAGASGLSIAGVAVVNEDILSLASDYAAVLARLGFTVITINGQELIFQRLLDL